MLSLNAYLFQQSSGLVEVGDGDANVSSIFNQREPLRQPRTSLPLPENNIGAERSTPASRGRSLDSLVRTSTLSPNAPEFYPSYAQYKDGKPAAEGNQLLREEVVKLRGELATSNEAVKKAMEAMKRQSDGLTKEYDRLLQEHQKLQNLQIFQNGDKKED